MACSPNDDGRDGFATAAATMISLALGLVAVAAVIAGLLSLRLARGDLKRLQIEDALDGAQQSAMVTLLAANAAGPIRWQAFTSEGPVSILAEPEQPKASLVSVIAMDDAALAPLQVANPRALRERLKTLSLLQGLGPDLEGADTSPLWRTCARYLISPFGLAEHFRNPTPSALVRDTPMSRAGQVWRFKASGPQGWTDDRVVRFTGDYRHPAATIERRFVVLAQEGASCDLPFQSAQ